MFRNLSLLMIFFLAGCAAIHKDTLQQPDYAAMGDKYSKESKFNEAIIAYQNALKSEETDSELQKLHLKLGGTYYAKLLDEALKSGKIDEQLVKDSECEFNKAIELGNSSPLPYYSLGNL